MAALRRTARAEDDLVEIWLYIAADNPDAADRLLEEIDRKCLLLAANPLLGRARPDIAPPTSLPAGRQLSHPLSCSIVLYRKASRSSASSTARVGWTDCYDSAAAGGPALTRCQPPKSLPTSASMAAACLYCPPVSQPRCTASRR